MPTRSASTSLWTPAACPRWRQATTLYYYLTDGGTPNNKTVNLSNFLFGGGNALGTPTLNGSACTLGTGVQITDSMFVNEFTQGFAPGSSLSFNVALPNVGVDSAGPDHFGFQIFDASGNAIASNDPTSGADLVGLDLNNTHLMQSDVQSYGYTVNGTTYTAQVSPLSSPGAAPEPAFYQMSALLGCGAVAMGLSRRRNRKAASQSQA